MDHSEQQSLPRAATSPDASEGLTWRSSLLLAAAGGFCWAVALGLLLSGALDAEIAVLAPVRVIFYGLVVAAGLLTFVPLQQQLNLPGLAREGVVGLSLLLYVIAFVPAPSGWLLWLPDLPVYLMLTAAVFLSVSALSMPLVLVIGKRVFHQRARQYDLRRAWRQAHEFGVLAAACVLLAGLRVLTLVGVVLVVLILVVGEMLLLSFVEAEA